MALLHALRCPPAATPALLRRRWDAGDAVVVLPPDAPERAQQATLDVVRPGALTVVDAGGRAVTRTLADPRPIDDDVALVVTTSGSTGRPKGVELTHAALDASTTASVDRLGCLPGERWALALPTHHVAGVQVVLRSWALGTEPEPVGRGGLATSTAAHVSLVPTQLARALDAGVDLARFRTVLLGGARPGAALLDRARAAGAAVVVSYGMSETGGGCVYDGRALDGVDVEVVDGRIRLRGSVMFRGYRGDPAATREVLGGDGWFTTGDLGQLVDGRLEVLGRADDVVISGGENVPVGAVGDRLRTHPAVADVGVVGRPDPDWGQVVVAVVVPADPSAPPTLDALRTHVRAMHPAAWAPRELVVVEELPRDAMGKVTRATLTAVIS